MLLFFLFVVFFIVIKYNNQDFSRIVFVLIFFLEPKNINLEVSINKDVEVNVNEDINQLRGVGQKGEDRRHDVYIFKKNELNKDTIEFGIEMIFEDVIIMRSIIKLYALRQRY